MAVYDALERGFDSHDWRHGNFSFIKIFIRQGLEEMMIKEAEHHGPKITGLRAKGSNGIYTSRPPFSSKSDLTPRGQHQKTKTLITL